VLSSLIWFVAHLLVGEVFLLCYDNDCLLGWVLWVFCGDGVGELLVLACAFAASVGLVSLVG